MTNSSAVVVSRASHTQYLPHDRRPHKLPVTSVTATYNTPISALAPAMRSQLSERVRGHRYATLATPVTTNAR